MPVGKHVDNPGVHIMAYAKRNADGDIIALYHTASEEGLEEVSCNHADVMRFLSGPDGDHESLAYLKQSDLDLVRVVEDLIELMVDKNLIMFTELPTAAQEKLLGRKQARENLNEAGMMMVDDTEII